MPPPQKEFSVFLDEPLYPIDFTSTESSTPFNPDRIEPEFGLHLLAFNMNVGRLITIARIKEESVRTDIPNSWYESSLLLCSANQLVIGC